MFNEVLGLALVCRTNLKDKYQNFLHVLDNTASHCGHLIEPQTVESNVPILVQSLTFNNLRTFLQSARSRKFWETVKDLQETEMLVFQTLGHIRKYLNANTSFDKSTANVIMGHFATISTTNDAFCTRMAARLILTAEQSTVFDENDLQEIHLLCFRLVATDELPSVEDRLRLLWDVCPIHAMRNYFLAWNNNLSRNGAALKAQLETLSVTTENVETEAHGLKRKAEEELQVDS
jgi:hypothetical protein